MKRPRWAAGRWLGGTALTLPEGRTSGAAHFSLFPKAPQKPQKPPGSTRLPSGTVKRWGGFSRNVLPQHLSETYTPTPTRRLYTSGTGRQHAPSAGNLARPAAEGRSRGRGVSGVSVSSTPTPTRWGPA